MSNGNTVIGNSLVGINAPQQNFRYTNDNALAGAFGDKSKPPKFSPPPDILVKASQGEGPKELHRRILLEAASRAGLDGTDE